MYLSYKVTFLLYVISIKYTYIYWLKFVDEKIAKVSENCKTHFKRIKESLISSVQELKSGTIQIRKLKLILNTEGRYKDIIAIMWKYENCKEFEDGCISSLLDRRHKELEKLDETIKNSVAFADLLQCFEGINDTN